MLAGSFLEADHILDGQMGILSQ